VLDDDNAAVNISGQIWKKGRII